jgi:hypothetical protein
MGFCSVPRVFVSHQVIAVHMSGNIKFGKEEAWQPEWWGFSNLEIWPVVTWEKVRSEDQSHVRIDKSCHIYGGMAGDSEAALPQGWTKKEDTFVFL